MSGKTGKKKEDIVRQFCTFWIGERIYGADIQIVKEINSERRICPIPHATSEILGYVNIRGQIFLIIDLRQRLGLTQQEIDPNARLVLFKSMPGGAFGILVDRIGDVIEVTNAQIEEHLQGTDCLGNERVEASHQFISGICQLEGRLLIIIDPKLLLELVCASQSLKKIPIPV